MKNLMKLFSIFLVVSLVALIVTSSVFSLSDIPSWVENLSVFAVDNILPVIIISICCVSMQKKNESFFVRITAAYMIFSIILSAAIAFLPLKDINEGLYDVLINIYGFVVQTHLYLLAYSLLSVINPNNTITSTIKKIAYIAILASIVVQIWVIIKAQMIEHLPNVYGYQGFNFATLKETAETAYKVMLISTYVEIISIILTYVTNYAFEADTIETENLDYDELKKQAENVALTRIENTYNPKPKEVLPDRSVSEKTGMMNINNQLGVNSNVGQVSGKTNDLPKTYVEAPIPISSGPIINDNLVNNSNISNNVVESPNIMNTNTSANINDSINTNVNNNIPNANNQSSENKFLN